jgi:hypothetical protein
MTQVRRVVRAVTISTCSCTHPPVSGSGTWAHLSQFKRSRVKALRPGHPLYRDERVCDRDPERLASELAAAAQHARSVGGATRN